HRKDTLTPRDDARDRTASPSAAAPEHDRPLRLPKKREPHDTVTALSRMTVALRYLEPFTAERIEQAIAAVAADAGWSVRDLTMAIRAAVTGRKVGPPLYESMALLGKERAVHRLE